MHLKRLELHGFKSFAARTVLEFSPGVTAIVGPNGSGKCIEGTSLVTLADGRDVLIRDLVEQALVSSSVVETLDDGVVAHQNPHDVRILSLNPATFRLEARPVTAFVKRTAPSLLVRVRTRSGREVTATPYHPLFTLERGQLRAIKAEELTVGLRIALPRHLPTTHRAIPFDAMDTLACFSEEDRVYVPNSTALIDLPPASNPNLDLVPGVTPLVKEAVRLAGVSVKRHRAGRAKLAAYAEERCEASRGGLREVVGQIEELGETPALARAQLDRLSVLADSDVYWDAIVSVEQITPSDPWVYDLSVAETHNFVAENIIVHNSNIADGIRWVLGEQSMRQLRGKKSDDVIFAGGQGRATMQMAEVGLVLDNSAAWLPSEFAEVAVARRSFRNGESEYLISGQRVRLKDVTMLLAQARVGHDSYTVIGQGLIDQALSLRAEERRGLFEDAAGIRQFQAQRNEAEQRLALTQSNLARLRDILGEIEPRLGPLAEQARRAREFSGARDELLRLLRIWYRRQWRELAALRERAEASESDHAARIAKLQDALAVEEALIQDLRQQREALVGELALLRRERNEAAAQAQVTERELAVARERLAALERQQTELAAEQEQQSDAVDVARAHLGGLEAQVARAEAETKSTSASLEAMERSLHTARQEQEREEARLRAAQRDAIQAQARLGAAQTELGRLQKQLGERNRVLAARRDAVAAAQSKLDAAQALLEERRREADAARADADALATQREALSREIADGQAEAERLRTALADAQRERSALGDRLTLLEDWRRNLEGFDEGVRALLQAPAKSRPALAGVVAQLISVPPGMELALETALGPLLHAVIVPTAADARQAGAWLRAARAGRAVFVWLDLVPGPWTPHPDLPEPDGVECIGYARDLITCAPDLRAVLAHLLGDTYLVRDLGIAERHWSGIPLPGPIVTLDGDHLHPRGWMRAGAVRLGAGEGAKESSMLARERELRQLPAEIERLDGAIADLQARYARATTLQGERRARAEGLRKEHERAEARAREAAAAAAGGQRDQERAQGELQVSQTVAEQLGAEVRGIEQEVAATTARVAEQEQAQREAAERVEDIQAEVDDLLAEARAQQEEFARARTAAAVQLQEVKALGQRAEQIRAQVRELELQMGRRAQRLEALQLQGAELAERIGAQDETLGAARERLRDLGEQLQQRDTRQAELERQALELERGQSHERAELARLEAEYRRCIVDAQRARDAIEALAQQIREELGSEDEEADPLERIVGTRTDDDVDAAEAAALSPDEAAKLRTQIDRLRGRIKHLGGYDPEAPQAYEELKTRFDFLTSQVHDMEQASTNLRAVIVELDATMRRQFEETFHAVNERFQRHFTTLFSGGAARLELTAPRRGAGDDEDDEDQEQGARLPAKGMGVGGVEVFVQIPGKRAQDLSLLSGGERAMVSAALLFSLLETNPPPFCLLDEVDAALDEANVTRFCEILKQLAEKTQFMVITHNRVTMTYADVIYGVSMDGAISRVLSMKLAEAAAIAR